MWGHSESRIVGRFLKPLNEVSGSTIDILWWYKPFSYGGLCPIYLFRELGFGGFDLCFTFCIFNRFVLEEYVSQVEGGPHLLQSCLRAG
jgi:hypothetical protein